MKYLIKTKLKVYNSITKKKEIFIPINYPFVGMYLCGPTVYGDSHIGHARSAVVFDVIFRYLKYLKYKVKYVRNITDIGHLDNSFLAEDKVLKQSKLKKVDPMELSQYYTNIYHNYMKLLNVQSPNIEPRATGTILDQIDIVKKFIKSGFAYEVNNSVYFNIKKYSINNYYGILSGRIVDDLISGNRKLFKQKEKKSVLDFALWKSSDEKNLVYWFSPWGYGFPGWHLECFAMSYKYLGKVFDIHGGGIDLLFPHHECEISQSQVLYSNNPAKYWLHNNLVNIDNRKMGKSLGNIITLSQIFNGNHSILDKPYSPMTIRFFILQAHYRSVIDFSVNSLNFARLKYIKFINGLKFIKNLYYKKNNDFKADEDLSDKIKIECNNCYNAINDDFNIPKLISYLFTLLKYINKIQDGLLDISIINESSFNLLKKTYIIFLEDILGLLEENNFSKDLLSILLNVYKKEKMLKNYSIVDYIRFELKSNGIILKDMKNNIDWIYN